jgi:hypothetical protein
MNWLTADEESEYRLTSVDHILKTIWFQEVCNECYSVGMLEREQFNLWIDHNHVKREFSNVNMLGDKDRDDSLCLDEFIYFTFSPGIFDVLMRTGEQFYSESRNAKVINDKDIIDMDHSCQVRFEKCNTNVMIPDSIWNKICDQNWLKKNKTN